MIERTIQLRRCRVKRLISDTTAKRFGEYPNTWGRDDDGDYVEYQSCDRQSKEGSEEAKDPYTDVPHAEAATCDSGEQDGRPEQTAGVRRPPGSLVKPCKVARVARTSVVAWRGRR
jgi:hypothetical protein